VYGEFKLLSVDALVPPRISIRVESGSAVDVLAESVKADGVLHPLLVRPVGDGRYEVVCGMRRLQAALKAGLQVVPCRVEDLSDVEAMEAMLVENMQRENLSDYEVGRWFKTLMEKFPDKYSTQQALASRFGLTQPRVAQLIQHYETIENLKQSIPSDVITRVIMLPETVVREVRRAPEELQPQILIKAAEGKDGKPLSVQEVREEVQKAVLTAKTLTEIEEAEKAAVEAEQFALKAPLEHVAARLQEVTAIKKEKFQQLLDRLSQYYPLNVLEDMLNPADAQKDEAKIIKRLKTLFEFEHEKVKELGLLEELMTEADRWQ